MTSILWAVFVLVGGPNESTVLDGADEVIAITVSCLLSARYCSGIDHAAHVWYKMSPMQRSSGENGMDRGR